MMSSNPLLRCGLSKQYTVQSLTTNSDIETVAAGMALGRQLTPNAVVCFFGDLGAGKTTFIRGVVAGATQAEAQVSSPTFTYLNIYPGACSVYHFDLYRLPSTDAFLDMGFDDYFHAGGICCLEWSERIASILPPEALCVEIGHISEVERHIVIRPRISNGS